MPFGAISASTDLERKGHRKAFARIDGRGTFHLKPDIALVRSGEMQFVLDAKWKKDVRNDGRDPKHGVVQDDIYQLYSYGRKFGCGSVALIYPRTRTFNSPCGTNSKTRSLARG